MIDAKRFRSDVDDDDRRVDMPPSAGRPCRLPPERWTAERPSRQDRLTDRLEGDSIPLAARIIAVCGAYEEMTTTHPYRRAVSEGDARAELRRCAGHQFDPRVVAAFERVIARGRADVSERLAA